MLYFFKGVKIPAHYRSLEEVEPWMIIFKNLSDHKILSFHLFHFEKGAFSVVGPAENCIAIMNAYRCPANCKDCHHKTIP